MAAPAALLLLERGQRGCPDESRNTIPSHLNPTCRRSRRAGQRSPGTPGPSRGCPQAPAPWPCTTQSRLQGAKGARGAWASAGTATAALYQSTPPAGGQGETRPGGACLFPPTLCASRSSLQGTGGQRRLHLRGEEADAVAPSCLQHPCPPPRTPLPRRQAHTTHTPATHPHPALPTQPPTWQRRLHRHGGEAAGVAPAVEAALYVDLWPTPQHRVVCRQQQAARVSKTCNHVSNGGRAAVPCGLQTAAGGPCEQDMQSCQQWKTCSSTVWCAGSWLQAAHSRCEH